MLRVGWAGLLAALVISGSQALAGPVPQVVASPTALVAEDGAWCWFSDPRAVQDGDTTFLGWISSRGDIVIGAVDGSGATTTAVVMTGFEVDDHDHPAVIVRPDGRVQAFWSRHNGTEVFTRTTTRPRDISHWGPLGTVPLKVAGDRVSTYVNPVVLSGEKTMWVFGRSGYSSPAFTTTRDLGRTWTPARRLVDVKEQRPYVKYADNGRDTIAMGFTNGHPAETHSSIYYAAYRKGALRGASGRGIAPVSRLPIAPSQADLVYASPKGRDAWVHDVALDAQGRPRIVFATMPDGGSTDHDYWYAAWDGRRWLSTRITAAGGSIADAPRESGYTAGISFDHDDPSTVVLARPGTTKLEVERWTTPDLGRSWTSEAVTMGSHQDNVRPVVPRGGSGRVVWMTGKYGYFTSFRTSVAADRTTQPRAAAPTDLSVTSKADGAGLAVSADLRTGVVGYVGKELTLQSRPVGWKTWDNRATAYTDNTGRVSVRVSARAGLEFRWVWPGDHEAARSESTALRG